MAVITPTRKNWAESMRAAGAARKQSIIIHGSPGIGKTSFAAHFQKPVVAVIGREDGVSPLREIGAIPADVQQTDPITAWEELLGFVEWMANSDHDRKTLVFDVLSGMEEMCHTKYAADHFKGKMGDDGFLAFQKGPILALEYWKMLIELIDKTKLKVTPVILSHSRIQTFKNPMGADYDRYVPNVSKETWGMTYGWCDTCLFADFVTSVSTKESGTAGVHKKGKATGSDVRYLYGSWNPAYDAKNRLALPEEGIDMGHTGKEGFDNFVAACKAGKKQ